MVLTWIPAGHGRGATDGPQCSAKNLNSKKQAGALLHRDLSRHACLSHQRGTAASLLSVQQFSCQKARQALIAVRLLRAPMVKASFKAEFLKGRQIRRPQKMAKSFATKDIIRLVENGRYSMDKLQRTCRYLLSCETCPKTYLM